MGIEFGNWTDGAPTPAPLLREERSGLSGFGGRPELHPAWRAPAAAAGPRGRPGRGLATAASAAKPGSEWGFEGQDPGWQCGSAAGRPPSAWTAPGC